MTTVAASQRVASSAIGEYGPPVERTPAIHIDGLTKRFKPRGSLRDLLAQRHHAPVTVVNDVSFDVAEGEVVGILGPNGAGKTTLFKMLATTVLPDDGTATVCDNDIHLEPARVRASLAAVSSDERSLNWRLSARENLMLFAALHRVPRREQSELVVSMLRTVGLEDTGSRMVAEFSSGMRQRLLIARALLARPKVLLLDEPTRALDPVSARDFRRFLRSELVERHGCTIVLATHNAEEALGFCDRVVVLNRGCVLATGSPLDLKRRFGEDRYRILTADPAHERFSRLEEAGIVGSVTRTGETVDGWHAVECAIPGDPSRTATVLHLLLESGVQIARFERIEPSLADLISVIIGASAPEAIHA